MPTLILKTAFVIFLALFYATPAAQASSLLQIGGKNRVVTVYSSAEIPDYLRSSNCDRYAYNQKFKGMIYLNGAHVSYPARAGSTAADQRILKSNGVCLLSLREESMLKGTHKPVTLYDIETFGRGANETHAGVNHHHMDDGHYTLESGTSFTVKNNVVIGR